MHSAHNTYLKTFQYIFEKNYNCIDYVLSKQIHMPTHLIYRMFL